MTKVYRRETHMDQYSPFSSNHPLEHKRGKVTILMLRVGTIVSDKRNKIEERSHVKQALAINGYPEWLINSIPTMQPSLERTTSVACDDTDQ